MYTKVNSMMVQGIDGLFISVETDVSAGLPEFSMVGYLSSEVREARERVRISLKNSGFTLPPRRITVNLSPADLRKEGTSFDLAVALGILASYGHLPEQCLRRLAVIGELGLDGGVRPVPGVLSMVGAAKEAGVSGCIVPKENEAEGALVEEMAVAGVENLPEAVRLLQTPGAWQERIREPVWTPEDRPNYGEDFSEVNGQIALKRAAEVAAAGMHNLLMIGPPGSGKTMVARRIPTILPELTRKESLEVSKIYSVCGLLPPDRPLKTERPFRAPHHTASYQSLVGGGRVPKPGELSLANRGVLFLDELPEFSRMALEVLRQPLEAHKICISRLNGTYEFPSHFLLVAAMNPCPCGYYPDRNRCSCTEGEVARYLGRISSPLLDRFDLCTEVKDVPSQQLWRRERGKTSLEIRREVQRVHEIQKARYGEEKICFNGSLGGRETEKYCQMDREGERLLKKAYEKMNLSVRGYHKILKTARTIADLDKEELIREPHISEAVFYRTLDDKYRK